MEKLEIKHLSKSFDDLQVLQDVSFTVHTGEFLSVLGSSGCGKTSLLRILIGLESPDSGIILKDGNNITGLPPEKRNMGFVFQNYALFENLSALKNVEYALRKSSATKELYTKVDAKRKAKEMLDLVGLSDHRDKRPCELSGGQQQRVAIARTLALNPDVILLDEPMSALDVDTRLALRSELKDLQQKFGTTMIYITHDQEEAFSLSDRIMVMKEGCIHQIDTPDHIIDYPADEFVVNFVINNINIKINSLVRFARQNNKEMQP